MHREVDGCQVGRAGLWLCAIGLKGAPYAPPKVDLVRQFERNLEIVVSNAIECWAVRLTIAGRLGAGGNGIRSDRWKVIGSVVAEHGASLGILGLGRLQVLVGDVDLRFEDIELRILKNFPPVTIEILVIRLGRFPIAHLFIGWRDLCCWAPIFRSNRASGHLERGYCEHNHPTTRLAPVRNPDQLSSASHLVSPGNVA